MSATNEVLVVALSLSIILNLSSSRLNYLFLFFILTAIVIIIFAINTTYGRFLRTAYNAFQAFKSVSQWLVAFAGGISTEEAIQQLKVHATKVIADLVETAREIYDDIIVSLARKASHAIYDCCIYLWGLLRLLLVKLNILPADTGEASEEAFSKEYQKKAVLFVTVPSGRSYMEMKKAISSDEPEPKTPLVNWASNDKGLLPPLKSLRTSIRHFAICLIPLDAWDDPTKCLLQKFTYGTFWELIGPDMVAREGEGFNWKADQIRMIDSVAEIGVVPYSDVIVSESFYRPLRAAWLVYEEVWWNSYDFAIRLAYLLVHACDRDKLHNIRKQIEIIRAEEVRTSEERIAVKGFSAGFGGFGASWVTGAGCSILFPPAVPFAVAGLFASFTLGMGSGLYGFYLQCRKEPSYMENWKQFSEALERRVPALRGFANMQPTPR